MHTSLINNVLALGVENARTSELLALTLNMSVDQALAMIESHNFSLAKLMTSISLLPEVAARAQAALELSRRVTFAELQRDDAISSPDAARYYVQSQMRYLESEVFACLYLDNHHRPIKFEKLFFGSIAYASVHAREVVRRCLHHNAAAVIFAHNHPSGVPAPSEGDISMTAKLKESLHLIDVRVLDHFVVGDTVVSFAESGLL